MVELEEYTYQITHRKGRDNNLPDYLSRARITSINLEVQDESGFEDKIFTLSGDTTEIDSTKLDLTKLQGEDAIISDAVEQLKETGSVSSGRLQEVSRSLAIVNGMLLYRDRAVVPLGARRTVLGLVHGAGHFGQKRTLQVLRRSYFWFGMAKDAQYWCRSCLVCQKEKAPNQARVPIQEFKMEGIGPGDLVAMDIGTLPWADQKFRYFVCIIDVFTRYMELIPLQDQSAVSLAREFQCGWIFRGHGVPKGLLTDQGHNIDGVEIRALCERLGIEKRHSSHYHPQGDGLVERSIGLAKQVARCLTLDRRLSKESWPEILPEVSFYCNNFENSSTKFSPQRLMTGRQPTSPIDAMISRKDLNQTLSHTVHIEELEGISAELEKLARENDLQAKQLRNDYHNKGAVTPCLKKGGLILERNETRKDSLDPKFNGPYTVLDSRGTNESSKRK